VREFLIEVPGLGGIASDSKDEKSIEIQESLLISLLIPVVKVDDVYFSAETIYANSKNPRPEPQT
jgi:hypothetical protein